MTQIPGLWYPPLPHPNLIQANGLINPSAYSAQIVDATNERLALIGHVRFEDRLASAKTLSSAGGKIHVKISSATFSNAGTTLHVGVQDVESAGAAPPARPDGTYDVYGAYVGGTDTISTSNFQSFPMETGSKSIANGDLIAIQILMVTRGGTDAVSVVGASLNTNPSHYPLCVGSADGSTWGVGQWNMVLYIEFDDGTFGFIDGAPCVDTAADVGYITASSNPDEYGLIFTAPMSGYVDALGYMGAFVSAGDGSDMKLGLFSDPLGTPVELASRTIYGDEVNNTTTNASFKTAILATPAYVHKGQKLCVSVRATSTGSVYMARLSFSSASLRSVTGIHDTTMSLGERDGASGAFTETTTKLFLTFMRYCSVGEMGSASMNIGGFH